MNIHIGTNTAPIIFVPSPEAMANMEQLMKGLGRVELNVPTAAPSADHGHPAIGDYWLSQGGLYAGDMRGDNGMIYGLIVAPGNDIGRATWGASGERDLSDWDGMDNTARLRNECPAAKLAAGFERDGHSDFYLPARRELQLACATVPHLFGKESWYWSSTPYSEDYAWAVDFEYGFTNHYHRRSEFRVRPFRRFVY